MTVNTIPNGDMEVNPTSGPNAWTKDAGTFTWGTTGGPQGAHYLQWAATSSASMRAQSPVIPCVAGQKVAWSAYLWQGTVAGTWQMSIGWKVYNGAGGYADHPTTPFSTAFQVSPLTTSPVQHIHPTLVVPDDVVGMTVSLRRPSAGGASGQTIRCDGVQVSFASPTGDDPDVSTFTLRPAASAFPYFMTYVLDDACSNDIPYMTAIDDLIDDGISFTQHVLTGPICAPSRASFLTGKASHNTGVFDNGGGVSAFKTFTDAGHWPSCWPAMLRAAGYYVVFAGKLINGDKMAGQPPSYPANWVPPGFDYAMVVDEDSEQQFAYTAVKQIDGVVTPLSFTGTAAANYCERQLRQTVLDGMAYWLANHSDRPLAVLVASHNPHDNNNAHDPEYPTDIDGPADPNDRPDDPVTNPNRPGGWGAATPGGVDGNLGKVAGVYRTIADVPVVDAVGLMSDYGPAHNTPTVNGPAWETGVPLGTGSMNKFRKLQLERKRQVQSSNKTIIDLRAWLVTNSIDNNTMIAFWSDNGWRMPWHALDEGKASPYDTDWRTNLIIRPQPSTSPTVGVTVDDVVQQIDLYVTYLAMAGVDLPADCDSRLDLSAYFDGGSPAQQRRTAFGQYGETPGSDWGDKIGSGTPPNWYGLRSKTKKYVAYDTALVPTAERIQFHDLDGDPAETTNIALAITSDDLLSITGHMAAYSAAAGEDFWAQALIALVGPGVDDPEAPRELADVLIAGYSVYDRDRWTVGDYSGLLGWASRRGENVAMPRDGRVWVPGKYLEQLELTLPVYIHHANQSGRRLLMDWLRRLTSPYTDDGDDLVELLSLYSDGTKRYAYVHIDDVVNSVTYGDVLTKTVLPLIAPAGRWQDRDTFEQPVEVDATETTQLIRFDSTSGATEVEDKPVLTIIPENNLTGPLTFMDGSTMPNSTSGVSYMDDLAAGEKLELNCRVWEALWTPSGGGPGDEEDRSALIRREAGQGSWLRLNPALGLAPGNGGAYRVQFTMGAPSTGTISFTWKGRRWYANG